MREVGIPLKYRFSANLPNNSEGLALNAGLYIYNSRLRILKYRDIAFFTQIQEYYIFTQIEEYCFFTQIEEYCFSFKYKDTAFLLKLRNTVFFT